MKRLFSLLAICTFMLCISSKKVEAIEGIGTFIVGAKLWYAGWDSSTFDDVQDDVYNGLDSGMKTTFGNDTITTITSDNSSKFGNGWLLGPVFGYQPPGGKWSLSLAFMWWSSFTQKMKTTYNTHVDPAYGVAGIADTNYTVPANIEIQLKRQEIDFAVTYSLTNYIKIFTGYKYSNIKVDVSGTLNLIHESIPSADFQSTVDAIGQQVSHSASIGAGYFYPLLESLIISTQAGILAGSGQTSSEDRIQGTKKESKWKTITGFNTEINASKFLSKHLIIQVGFRYQPTYSNSAWDHFFGGTMAALVYF